MRLLLNFKLEKEEFKKDYRRVILSFLKKAMSEEFEGMLFNKYFKENHYRDYGFTVFFDEPVFQKDCINVKGKRLRVLLSSDDRNKTGLYFYGAVLAQKGNKFPLPMDNSMVLERVMPINTTEITKSRISGHFLTGGGLVLREHNKETNKDIYHTYNSPKFKNIFDVVVQNQLKTAGFDDDIAESVKFTPIDCKKSVVQHYSNLIDTTLGTFVLEGNVKALQYLYNSGIGSRNGFGFGLFDVIDQE